LDLGQVACAPQVRELLRADTPKGLAEVAEVCGQHDPDAGFTLGLDLMLRGLADTQA
jgi:hypothetical protein